MKSLTLLRHAKSSWDDAVPRDFDRPLNPRGARGARRIGRYLRDESLTFDHLVSSPAVRCTETLDHVWEGYGRSIVPNWDRRIYLASAVTLLDVVHDAPDHADRLLMVGHNPGLEDLILLLVADEVGDVMRDSVEEKFPTAALAELELDIAHWSDASSARARLVRFIRPRDLDPALGPEDHD